MVDTAIKELASIPKLPLSSGLLTSAKESPKGYLGSKEVGPAYKEIKDAEILAEQKVGEAEVAIEAARRAEKATEAEQKAKMYTEIGQEMQGLPERKALTEGRQELRNMAFVPTQDTAQNLAVLFSLISVVGMVVGKDNSQLAMSAMNGMLEGYQKGRADLYKKEKDIFDKNFKAMQTKITTLEKELTEAMDVKKYDAQAREQRITVALARAENPPLLKALKDKVGNVAVLNAVRGVRKDVDTLVNLQNNLQSKADARADAAAARAQQERIARENRLAADERARLAREQNKQLAELRASQPGRQGQNALTFASRVYGNIENATNDLVNLTNLPAVAESPIFAGMIGADRDTVLRNITAFAARKVTDKDQRAFEQIANSLDAALARLEAQGLANGSTRAAIASFSAIKPREGDDAINMAIYLARVKQEIETGIKVHAEMPGATPGQKQNNLKNIERINRTVPFSVEDTLNVLKANRKPLGKKMEQLLTQPQIVPNVSMKQQDTQNKYEMNQIIKKGNKTYRIIGLDDPNDPDIEEVK